jgi:hypothetical protein
VLLRGEARRGGVKVDPVNPIDKNNKKLKWSKSKILMILIGSIRQSSPVINFN